ncbi:MAG: cobalamin biosynthesis protein CobD, partial [Burkholderiales bacterium]|nr:cobalamin biosynthesis protein CobD [Burkholderiales bacterium]
MIEQLRPLPSDNAVQAAAARWFDNLVRQFNVGERRQGLIAWLLAVVPWVIGVLLVYKVLGSASWVLVLAFNVAVLYFLIGFRQISNSFTAV